MVDPQTERLAGTNSRSTNQDAQLFSSSINGRILPSQEISPPSGLAERLARASFDANLLNNFGESDPPSPIPLSNSMRLAFQANLNDSNFPGSVGYQERRIRNNPTPSIVSRRSNYSSSIADSTDLDSLSIVPEKKSLNISVQEFYDSIMYGEKSNHSKNICKFDSHVPNPHLSNSSLNIPVTPDMVKMLPKETLILSIKVLQFYQRKLLLKSFRTGKMTYFTLLKDYPTIILVCYFANPISQLLVH